MKIKPFFKNMTTLLITLFLVSCGSSGDSGGGVNVENNPIDSTPGEVITVSSDLFKRVDDALKEKTVSTTTPEGLWLIYSKGVVNSDNDFTSSGAGTLEVNKNINLFAVVVNVYTINETGTPSVHVNWCSGSHFYNEGNMQVNRIPTNEKIDQFTISLVDLDRFGGALFPYIPGDIHVFV